MRRAFEYGGIVASVVLIVAGTASVVMGITGRDRVRDDLGREKIVGTPDSSIPDSSWTRARRRKPSRQ